MRIRHDRLRQTLSDEIRDGMRAWPDQKRGEAMRYVQEVVNEAALDEAWAAFTRKTGGTPADMRYIRGSSFEASPDGAPIADHVSEEQWLGGAAISGGNETRNPQPLQPTHHEQ